MATQRISLVGDWQLVHTATTNDTSIIFTPRVNSVNWAIATSIPGASFAGHMADSGEDREVFLEDGESFYVNGSESREFYVTITE